MTMPECNGQCHKYQAEKPKGGYYFNGKKNCIACDRFLDWDGSWCPCCSCKLRTRPRNKTLRQKLQEGHIRI